MKHNQPSIRHISTNKILKVSQIHCLHSPCLNYNCLNSILAEKQSIEGQLTMVELGNYLKKVRNNVSPGSSGFTGEFFKLFWKDLSQFMLSSVNYSFEIGSLSVSQKFGILTLLPKGQKDKCAQ